MVLPVKESGPAIPELLPFHFDGQFRSLAGVFPVSMHEFSLNQSNGRHDNDDLPEPAIRRPSQILRHRSASGPSHVSSRSLGSPAKPPGLRCLNETVSCTEYMASGR